MVVRRSGHLAEFYTSDNLIDPMLAGRFCSTANTLIFLIAHRICFGSGGRSLTGDTLTWTRPELGFGLLLLNPPRNQPS